MNSSFRNYILVSTLFIIICLVLYPFIVAAYYSHPNAEDFSLAANPKNNGILNAAIQLLISYDGRYFVNILHGLSPLAFNQLNLHKYHVIFNVLFPIACFNYFIIGIFPKRNKMNLLIFSGLFICLLYLTNASIVHLTYWISSSFVYLYSWCFYLLWLGSFIRYFYANNSNLSKQIYWFIGVFFLLASMGINEMFLVLNLGTLYTAILYFYLFDRKKITYILPILLVGGIAFTFFISNPGINQRLSSLEKIGNDFSFIAISKVSIKHFFIEFFRILFKNPFTISCFILSAQLLNINKNLTTRISTKTFLFFSFIALVNIYLMTIPYYFGFGADILLPIRIFSAVDLMLIIWGWGNFIFFIQKVNDFKVKYYQITLLGISILLLGLKFDNKNNFALLKRELESKSIQKFDLEMKDRYLALDQKSNNTCWNIVELKPLSNQPKSIYSPPDIEQNRKSPYWNKAYENYFLIDEVRLMNDTLFKVTILYFDKNE